MSLSESNYNIYGNDIAIEPTPTHSNDNEQNKEKYEKETRIAYITKLSLSIRSLESLYEKAKKKRRTTTILLVAALTLIITCINEDISNIGAFFIAIIESALLSAVFYTASWLLLYYSTKKNTEDIIRIEKFKTELAVLENKKETTYDLPTYHNMINSMEDWL